jgi:hypothetical protein
MARDWKSAAAAFAPGMPAEQFEKITPALERAGRRIPPIGGEDPVRDRTRLRAAAGAGEGRMNSLLEAADALREAKSLFRRINARIADGNRQVSSRASTISSR